jgi:hypothetical protein
MRQISLSNFLELSLYAPLIIDRLRLVLYNFDDGGRISMSLNGTPRNRYMWWNLQRQLFQHKLYHTWRNSPVTSKESLRLAIRASRNEPRRAECSQF